MRTLILSIAVVLFTYSSAMASPTGWEGYIIARGARKAQIKSMHILQRPNRPLHFYGNTVRRLHYQGRFIPSIREVGQGAAAFLRRR